MGKFGISHFIYVIGDNWKWTSRSTILLFVFYLSCLLSLLPFFSFSVFFWINQSFKCFFDSSVGKDFICNTGDPGLIPGSGMSIGEGIGYPLQCSWASLVAQLVKNLPAMWEICIWSLDWEDPLEKGKAYPLQYSGLENSMDCTVHGIARVRHNWATFTFTLMTF